MVSLSIALAGYVLTLFAALGRGPDGSTGDRSKHPRYRALAGGAGLHAMTPQTLVMGDGQSVWSTAAELAQSREALEVARAGYGAAVVVVVDDDVVDETPHMT